MTGPGPAGPAARDVFELLRSRGVTHVVGLPDTAWAPLGRLVAESGAMSLVRVTREGEAFALASGLWLGGAHPVVAVQGTGLLESGDALRGTAARMGAPIVCLVTHRGRARTARAGVDPSSGPPERQELVRPDVDSAALLLEPTLRAWGVPWETLADPGDLSPLDAAFDLAFAEERPVAVVLARALEGGASHEGPGEAEARSHRGQPLPEPGSAADRFPRAGLREGGRLTPAQLLGPLARRRTGEVVVTTMSAVRPWGRLSDHDLDWASADSAMGHAADLALGVALARPDRRVVCLNGDGSMLMSLGTLVTVVDAGAANLVLFVLENGTYEITGHQAVPGAGAYDLAAMARAAGFPRVHRFEDAAAYEAELEGILARPGPTFVSVAVERGSEGPIGRGDHEDARYLKTSLAEWSRSFKRALAAERPRPA